MTVMALPAVGASAAGFIEDSKASLELRNFYLNRDFRENAGQNKREEWAQGFILNLESGYTQGTVGFGVDAIGMLGIKLDSSPDRSGTDLLTRDSRNRAEDDYSKLGVTGKVRFAESQLRVGTLLPKMPTCNTATHACCRRCSRAGRCRARTSNAPPSPWARSTAWYSAACPAPRNWR